MAFSNFNPYSTHPFAARAVDALFPPDTASRVKPAGADCRPIGFGGAGGPRTKSPRNYFIFFKEKRGVTGPAAIEEPK